jgi:AcrR family transcriptional regulator
VTDGVAAARSPGRPRRHDPVTEIRLLLDATEKLMRANAYEDVTVGAILTESGLSTRSFYRHFESKDQLLAALYGEHASRLHELLLGRVAQAGTPLESLEAWVDGVLRLRYDERTSRKVAVFVAAGPWRGIGATGVVREAADGLLGLLTDVLEAGRADGSFPLADPVRDGRTIYAIAMDLVQIRPSGFTRDDAFAHLMRFALRGMGVGNS